MGKSKKIIVFLMTVILAFAGCTKYDNFSDRAKIKQADNNLGSIKNALERYYLDNITYPPNGADLEKYIGKFFVQKDTSGKIMNKWKTDVVNAFYQGKVYYETSDSLRDFFIWAKANDKLHTIVSVGTKNFKDPVKIKEERDKAKKALEEAIRKNRLKMAREKRLKSKRAKRSR